MCRRLAKKHNVMCTSRNYREVTELAKIRNFKMEMVGRHGGERLDSKLDAGIKRMQALSAKIQRFRPDITVSFCSPDASRISFGLGIPHIGFSNAPHSEAVMRLSVPLLSRLLTPSHIQKIQFTKYGIDQKRIIQYDAMDEFLIVNNKKIPSKLPDMKLDKNKTIVFRTYEVQASYAKRYTDVYGIIDALLDGFPDCNIIVIGRYTSEISQLKMQYRGQNVIILDKVVDSKAILSVADLFIGSGGTMTTEAVLRKIPSISYEAAPNPDEKYLAKRGLLVFARTPEHIVRRATKILASKDPRFESGVSKFISEMSDPFLSLQSAFASIGCT